MITGYNTDVEHDGVIYHVQTEDKGLETPLLLSLVYAGGAILASKRSTYHDLIAAGFDEAVLLERLQRQHRLICAAINAGRLGDLKKLGAPARNMPPAPSVDQKPLQQPRAPDTNVDQAPMESAVPLPNAGSKQPTPSAYTVYDSRRGSQEREPAEVEEGLRIDLVGGKDFRGGDAVELKVTVIRISGQADEPVSGAVISVKILGTSFRPVILSLKTDRQGTAMVSTRIPPFKSGRAAIVIRASAAQLSTETRRVVHPA